MGIPFYLISRMVRYRIRELHKWQVGYAARQAGHTSTTQKGGAWLTSTILTARRQLSWPVEAGNEFVALFARTDLSHRCGHRLR
jgi:hypothetical protein